MSERDEMREDKIRQYMEDDARTRIEEGHGVRFVYYDGDLESAEIEDPEELLAHFESEWLEKLQDDDDEEIEMILAYCWLERKKKRVAELHEKMKADGVMPRIPRIETICLDASCDEFLENLIVGA